MFNIQHAIKLGTGIREVGADCGGGVVQRLAGVASPGAGADALYQVQRAAYHLRVCHQGQGGARQGTKSTTIIFNRNSFCFENGYSCSKKILIDFKNYVFLNVFYNNFKFWSCLELRWA
jgi:hypothetical protein